MRRSKRYFRYESEERAAEQSAYTERALFGSVTTGIYSNADVVANYEGHRFDRSLFEDGIIPGKPAILRRENGGWIVQRDFDWADHVNACRDEALKIKYARLQLQDTSELRLDSLCPVQAFLEGDASRSVTSAGKSGPGAPASP